MRIQLVSRCDMCPFRNRVVYSGFQNETYKCYADDSCTARKLPSIDHETPAPDWCPIRGEGVTVQLAGDGWPQKESANANA